MTYHKLSISSSKPLDLNLSNELSNSHVVNVFSKNVNLTELYLLQALLNQDFAQFSSNEDSEMFAEDNVLLVFNKKQVLSIIDQSTILIRSV